MMPMNLRWRLAAMILGTSAVVGCSLVRPAPHDDRTFAERLPIVGQPAPPSPEDPYPQPAKMAATWTPDTLIQSGRTPTRGFGGRVFFYDPRSRAVPVAGTLVVHAYDDTEGQGEQSGLKRYEFTPDQLRRHFSQSDLGASYSVWIPWDAVGGPQRRISLVASFRTAEGHTVQGMPATVMLPGSRSESSRDGIAGRDRWSPAFRDHQHAVAMASHRQPSITTTRIASNVTPARRVEPNPMTVKPVTPKTLSSDTSPIARPASYRMGELGAR